MTISSRLSDALALAVEAHEGQVRKGTTTSYIAHVMSVAALVLEYGGNEDQAIAGLLHDVIEDGGDAYGDRIRTQFGEEVLRLVQGCTDGTAEEKAKAVTAEQKQASWKARKDRYLESLASEDHATLLVSACDKLHNARAIVADLESIGTVVFERFTAGREGTLWYYSEIEGIMRQRGSPVSAALGDEVHRMKGAGR
jgi:(p)ppGpp synthase/HD superfamily hydrolase